jgi:hypothetical protein
MSRRIVKIYFSPTGNTQKERERHGGFPGDECLDCDVTVERDRRSAF